MTFLLFGSSLFNSSILGKSGCGINLWDLDFGKSGKGGFDFGKGNDCGDKGRGDDHGWGHDDKGHGGCGGDACHTTVDQDYSDIVSKYGAGATVLVGSDGDDRLTGTTGNDVIYGEDGDDKIGGHKGNDIVLGGDGNDYLHSDGGAWSIMLGGAGNDTVYGDANGNDFIVGGTGDDLLDGGLGGKDVLTGGSGADKFTIRGTAGNAADEYTITQTQTSGWGCHTKTTSITLDVAQKVVVTDLNFCDGDQLQLDYFNNSKGNDLLVAAGITTNSEVRSEADLKKLVSYLDKQTDYDHTIVSGSKANPTLTLLMNGDDGKVHAVALVGYDADGDHVGFHSDYHQYLNSDFFGAAVA